MTLYLPTVYLKPQPGGEPRDYDPGQPAMDGQIAEFTRDQTVIVTREQQEVENLQFLLENLRTDELENLGYALVGLRIADSVPWDGGKSLLTLESPVPGAALPRTTLRTGETVHLVSPHAGAVAEKDKSGVPMFAGVVNKVTNSCVMVAMDKGAPVPKKWNGRCSVKVRTTDITHRRMLEALDKLAHFKGRRPSLHRVLFGGARPAIGTQLPEDYDGFLDTTLNEDQRAAIRLALAARDVALIHGPPGTGKTHTLIEIIRQLVASGNRLLVCGASNVSVDNIAERLGRVGGVSIVRMGHPARIRKSVLQHTAASQAKDAVDFTMVDELRKELSAMLRAARRCQIPEQHSAIYAQTTVLRKQIQRESRKLTEKAGRAIVSASRVVLSTLCGAGCKDLVKTDFDVVIIDEATQALEAECWIAAIKAPKVILAGDHHQLPPTMINQTNQQQRRAAEARGAGNGELMFTTMFERVRGMFGATVCHMLTVQYRMHVSIMKVSSENLYDNKLVAHSSVAGHVLADLAHVEHTPHTAEPLVFIDTTDRMLRESFEKVKWMSLSRLGRPVRVSKSLVNRGEAQLAVEHATRLIMAGVPAKDIAIISPYNGQVRLLKLLCRNMPDIDIGSVDGFQGSEKEAVILSLVRSNDRQDIGFLTDHRRINVAITRARRHLCVVADGNVISSNKFLENLVHHLDATAHMM